ncbi:hypothetical protein OH76DRAFT_259265 [Lentinus brumalis]|uniref:Uncharacterized protein n=1 Tax=Lentinus brumalis TaxID=2498619 RepID=A0A371DGF2_9APHY|nr:hypothetical protein OH76DRAFT_259265 [Polyporus brumalis]
MVKDLVVSGLTCTVICGTLRPCVIVARRSWCITSTWVRALNRASILEARVGERILGGSEAAKLSSRLRARVRSRGGRWTLCDAGTMRSAVPCLADDVCAEASSLCCTAEICYGTIQVVPIDCRPLQSQCRMMQRLARTQASSSSCRSCSPLNLTRPILSFRSSRSLASFSVSSLYLRKHCAVHSRSAVWESRSACGLVASRHVWPSGARARADGLSSWGLMA